MRERRNNGMYVRGNIQREERLSRGERERGGERRWKDKGSGILKRKERY